MPVASPYEQGVFRVNRPEVVAWCEAFSPQWANLLHENGVLTEEEVESIQTAISDERQLSPSNPAEEWHAGWIPNGDYSAGVMLEDDDDDDAMQRFEYRIHLVERGQLTGKRIVKVKMPGSTIYSGFAFVTRDGRLDLWRRFTRDADEKYVLAAAAMLNAISDAGSRGDARYVARVLARNRGANVSETLLTRPRSVFGHGETVTVEWRVRQIRCLHCNSTAVNPMPGPFPLCTDHSRVPERPVVPAPSHAADYAENRRQARTRRRSEAPVGATGPLMSEVNARLVR